MFHGRVHLWFCCALLVSACAGNAGMLITTPSTAVVDPGTSFEFTVSVDTEGQTLVGWDAYIEVEAGGSGMFRLTGRDASGSLVDDLVPDPPSFPYVLAPTSSDPFGASVADVFSPVGPSGSLFLSTFTVEALAFAAGGTYTFSLVEWNLVYGDFSSESGASGPSFDITVTGVVPEPGCCALLLAAVGWAGIRRRRRD